MIAVSRAEWCGDMISGHFLKFGEVFFGGFGVAAALVSARDSKFSRRMKWKYRKGLLKRFDGSIVALQLRIQIADEIPGVGFVGNLRDVRERLDAFFRVT